MTQWQPGGPGRRGQLPPPAIPPQFGQNNQSYQQSPQPQFQPAYQQPPRYAPPPRGSRKGWAAIGCLGAGGLFMLVAAVAASHPSPSSPSATLPGTQAAAPAARSTAAAKPVIVATFTGSGAQKTPQFTTTATWALSYAFDCSSFGYKGNFVVLTDGGSDFSGASVNDLAMSKSAVTYAYDDAGTHYLEVNSECSWTVKVIDQG